MFPLSCNCLPKSNLPAQDRLNITLFAIQHLHIPRYIPSLIRRPLKFAHPMSLTRNIIHSQRELLIYTHIHDLLRLRVLAYDFILSLGYDLINVILPISHPAVTLSDTGPWILAVGKVDEMVGYYPGKLLLAFCYTFVKV